MIGLQDGVTDRQLSEFASGHSDDCYVGGSGHRTVALGMSAFFDRFSEPTAAKVPLSAIRQRRPFLETPFMAPSNRPTDSLSESG
jgi:hypothetical protein